MPRKKKKFQKKDRVQLEGRNSVLEALEAGRRFKRILIDRRIPQEGKILEIIKKARGKGVSIEFVARGGLNYVSQTDGMHQGVVAVLWPRERYSLKKLIQEKQDAGEQIFILMLTEVFDEGNLGAIIRSAAASGVQAVVVPQQRNSPVTPTVARASAGMVEHIPVITESMFQALKYLKDFGVKLMAVEINGTKSIYEADLTGDVAIIIGGEDKGVSSKVQEKVDETLVIPMPGKAQSLNMSVSAALVMFEKVRQESS